MCQQSRRRGTLVLALADRGHARGSDAAGRQRKRFRGNHASVLDFAAMVGRLISISHPHRSRAAWVVPSAVAGWAAPSYGRRALGGGRVFQVDLLRHKEERHSAQVWCHFFPERCRMLERKGHENPSSIVRRNGPKITGTGLVQASGHFLGTACQFREHEISQPGVQSDGDGGEYHDVATQFRRSHWHNDFPALAVRSRCFSGARASRADQDCRGLGRTRMAFSPMSSSRNSRKARRRSASCCRIGSKRTVVTLSSCMSCRSRPVPKAVSAMGWPEVKKLTCTTLADLSSGPRSSTCPGMSIISSDGTLRQETYFVKVVMPSVEETYPTLAESKGGDRLASASPAGEPSACCCGIRKRWARRPP